MATLALHRNGGGAWNRRRVGWEFDVRVEKRLERAQEETGGEGDGEEEEGAGGREEGCIGAETP